MKDLGELKYFLGIEFARSEKGILMHQRKYILELISQIGLEAAKPVMTPMDTNVKSMMILFLRIPNRLNLWLIKDPIKSLCITITRPDISFCVQNVS